jgi:hypothetical protein
MAEGAMETERMALSQRERDRIRLLHEVKQGHVSRVEAAKRLKLSDRQVRRLLSRIAQCGDQAVIHGLRGRPSNRRLTTGFEQRVLARVGQRYRDFGPTLAAEHLAQEGLLVSRERLRKWMTQATGWLALAAFPRPLSLPAPLPDRRTNPSNTIKPKYHVPADHPWRKPWRRTILCDTKPDISTLR